MEEKYKEDVEKQLHYLQQISKKSEDELIVELINRRERQILVHSYIYEDLNKNLIDDTTWDLWAKQLVYMFIYYPEHAEKSEYYKYFVGWTGDTASDLQTAYRLPEIMDAARRLLND